MKIAVFDPYLRKFTDGMEKWWTEHGHEVRMDRYYNPAYAEWADIIWFDTCDNNLKSATKPSDAILSDESNYFPWDLHDMDLRNKRVIVRPIDIEVWQGHHLESRWDVVDEVIFIADHIKDLAEPEKLPEIRPETRIHTIPCGVDLDKWTFKERTAGKNIAIVSERWASKGTHLLLQVMLKLHRMDPTYQFTWLGQRSDYQWEHAYRDEFVEHHNLPLEFVNILQDNETVDQFLEDKNFLLHGSIKEGFSYATAEAMAKGIKPIIHRFYGADGLWPGITWDTIDEAVSMITSPTYDSYYYLNYLIDHGYTLPQVMERIDKVIQGE